MMTKMNTENTDTNHRYTPNPNKFSRVFGGLILVAIGVLLLLRESGIEIPSFLLSWEMALITFGFYVGVKHRFRNPVWFISIIVGGLFMAEDVFTDISYSAYIWPLLIIFFGIAFIFKPAKKCESHKNWQRWEHKWKDKWEWENTEGNAESNDMIETVSIFAGVKKNIISKNFKGGEVTCVFGGAEVNLMQADFTGTAVLELTQIFGGTKLVVPAHWEIQQNDLVAVLGGIEDKRHIQKDTVIDSAKVLVLRGTCIMGGIEINSYA